MRRLGAHLAISTAALLCIAAPAAAQDEGLDALLFVSRPRAAEGSDVRARGVQLYRLPLSFRLLSPDDRRWGLRLTFPVSLSSLRIEGLADVDDFVKKLGIAAVVPGIEAEVPIGPQALMRPFAEVGIGRGSDTGDTRAFYGAGVRVRIVPDVARVHLTVGGSAAYRNLPVRAGKDGRYGSIAGGADLQFPLRISIGERRPRAGVYAIARAFDGLEVDADGPAPIVLGHQMEAGVSFSTAPDLRLWVIRLPWIAAGYQFGHVISGVRIYTMFPF